MPGCRFSPTKCMMRLVGDKARTPAAPEIAMISPARVFTLTLPSELSILSVARSFVESVGQACSLERPTLHAIVMATGEAVSNIVRHAHRHLATAQLQIRLEVEPEAVALVFQDQGEPFDLAAVPHM